MKLQTLLAEEGMGQAEVAKAANVSQSTICRVLERGYIRRSKARKRIEEYLEKNALKQNNLIPPEVSLAVSQVWDKTTKHAQLLAGVIRALEGLVPEAITTPDAREHTSH